LGILFGCEAHCLLAIALVKNINIMTMRISQSSSAKQQFVLLLSLEHEQHKSDAEMVVSCSHGPKRRHNW
jgi:hypothetical protein